MLPKFELFLPKSLDEALVLLAGEETMLPVCGGTDLLVRLRAGAYDCKKLVSIDRLPELQSVEDYGGAIFVGAACSLSHLEGNELVRANAPLLAQGCAAVGSPAIRNRGSIGGNVENASPAGDALTSLYGERAEVVLVSARGERRLPIDEYIIGPRRTMRKADELIRGFLIPKGEHTYHKFFKVGRRNALAISIVNGCVSAASAGNEIQSVDIVLGAVAATPVRLSNVAEQLSGRAYTKEADQLVQSLVEQSIRPIDDVRAGREYRSYIAGIAVRRCLRAAAGWEAHEA